MLLDWLLAPNGHLGCSPDGIVLENGVPLAALRLNGHIPKRI